MESPGLQWNCRAGSDMLHKAAHPGKQLRISDKARPGRGHLTDRDQHHLLQSATAVALTESLELRVAFVALEVARQVLR